MTESSHKTFTDRRTSEQRNAELATQVLFWYDQEGRGRKRRRRTNGLAVSTDGSLVVARATCSRRDPFVKAHGRLVVEKRILGRAQRHCWVLTTIIDNLEDMPEACARAYSDVFPDDEKGIKRAYNAGKIFVAYREEIDRRASEQLDEF